MPLNDILQALKSETERLEKEIQQATQAEIDRIRTQAQTEAEAVRQKHITAIEVPLQAEQARILNQAKLEALQIVMGTREDLMIAALEAALCRLNGLASTNTSAGLLQQLTQEAVDALGGNSLCLQVQSSEVASMERIAQEMGLSATVAGGLEDETAVEGDWGGLVATTADGRISLINTPAVRLRRVASLHRAKIAEMLFDPQQEE